MISALIGLMSVSWCLVQTVDAPRTTHHGVFVASQQFLQLQRCCSGGACQNPVRKRGTEVLCGHRVFDEDEELRFLELNL